MCYFVELLINSANNQQACLSIADGLPTFIMGPERSRKRVRATSDEIEAVLFSGEVAPITAPSTNPITAPSSKRARITATNHQERGWASAAQPAIHRTEKEYNSEKPGWDNKLAKCKNALARSVVESAFAKHTPSGWKGKRFCSTQGNIVQEKEVITDQGPSFNSV